MKLTYKQEQELARFTETKLLHLALIEMVNGILAEQAGAGEQGRSAQSYTCPRCCGGVGEICRWCAIHDLREQPAQPPAGDAQMVERMAVAGRNAVDTCTVGNMLKEGWTQAMAAALAVATEERDAQWEKALRIEFRNCFGHTDTGLFDMVRARLAKPAERVTVEEDEFDWIVRVKNGQRTYFPKQTYLRQRVDEFASGLRQELRESREAGK
jgi:hypothetical protein